MSRSLHRRHSSSFPLTEAGRGDSRSLHPSTPHHLGLGPRGSRGPSRRPSSNRIAQISATLPAATTITGENTVTNYNECLKKSLLKGALVKSATVTAPPQARRPQRGCVRAVLYVPYGRFPQQRLLSATQIADRRSPLSDPGPPSPPCWVPRSPTPSRSAAKLGGGSRHL